MTLDNSWLDRAKKLKLYGLVAHWDEITNVAWVKQVIEWEEIERAGKSLRRRLSDAHLDSFKPLTEFDWSWPKKCDQRLIEELMGLDFIQDKANVIFCGPNGVGKTMIVKNIAHQAVMSGHSVIFVSAGTMLNNLASLDSDHLLRNRINYYCRPPLLIIDEVGYLSYGTRHADLLFEIVNRRYEDKSIIVTTNKSFGEWNEIFPSASCVVSLIDRLVHNSEITNIEGDSYRLKESKEKSQKRREDRKKKNKPPKK